MLRKINILRHVLDCLYQVLYIFLLMNLYCLPFNHEYASVTTVVIMAATVVAAHLLRANMSRNVYTFVGLSIMGVLQFLLVHNIYMRAFLLVMTVVLFMDAQAYTRRKYHLAKMPGLPAGAFLLEAVVIIMGNTMKRPDLVNMGIIITVILFLMFLAMLYLQGLEVYLISTENISGLPIHKIISMNSVIIVLVMTLTLIMIGLANWLGFGDLLERLWYAIAGVIRIIGFFFVFIFRSIFGLLSTDSGKEEATLNTAGIRKVVEETNPINNFIDFLFALLVFTIVAIILIVAFRKFYKMLSARMQKDEGDLETVDIVKKKTLKRGETGGYVPEKETSMEKKARRIYMKRVAKYKYYFTPGRFDSTENIRQRVVSTEYTIGDYIREEESIHAVNGVIIPKEETESSANTYDAWVEKRIELKKQQEYLKEHPEEDPENKFRELTKLYDAVRYGHVIPDKAYLKKMKEL